MSIVATGPIDHNDSIKHLSATSALPGIKGADIIIKFLSEHSAFTAWTLHSSPPGDKLALITFSIDLQYIMRAKFSFRQESINTLNEITEQLRIVKIIQQLIIFFFTDTIDRQ